MGTYCQRVLFKIFKHSRIVSPEPLRKHSPYSNQTFEPYFHCRRASSPTWRRKGTFPLAQSERAAGLLARLPVRGSLHGDVGVLRNIDHSMYIRSFIVELDRLRLLRPFVRYESHFLFFIILSVNQLFHQNACDDLFFRACLKRACPTR